MGYHFGAMSGIEHFGIEHFVIDQAVTVDFTGQGPDRWVRDLLTELDGTLAAYG
jgi:hypothetical protein